MGARRDELEWLALLQETLPPAPPGETWIGDDAAVIPAPAGWVLLTVDSAIMGVHADPDLEDLADLGWKALVRGLSDVAAMGGDPWRAVVAVSGPAEVDIEQLYEGLGRAATEFACPIVGGDLSSADQLVVTAAVTGVVGAGTPPPVPRKGARPGDRVWVTGPLGRSAAGLRELRTGAAGSGVAPAPSFVEAHRRPRPRLAAGRVARLAGASAMIDVSDGLTLDISRLAAASGVSVRMHEVPVAPGATEEEALGGGEDYELVVCAPPDIDLGAVMTASGEPTPLPLGVCDGSEPGTVRLDGRPLVPTGWRHWGTAGA